ncbi:MAG: PCP reductase family protein [Bacteroidetes bacterium]|nr:PCP reductase family protein [Bacteroidota bacterium]
MRSPFLDKCAEIIFRELTGIITENDYTEYSAKKSEAEKYTQTIFRTYNGEKISRLVFEQYTVNSKAYGVVLNIYPKPEFGIPLFTFQLGGQIPDKVIFVTDIIPIIKSPTDTGISEIYRKHSTGMNNLGSAQEWINQICTGNALICQYKPLEPEKILSALTEYLCYWRDAYYLPAKPDIPEEDQKPVVENILKFKTILHENDAGLEIYLKKFGKEMMAVIENAAFGSEPSLQKKILAETENSSLPDQRFNTNDGILWSAEAEAYLQDAPKFVRSRIKNNAEQKALELGIKEITRTFIENLRK